jgi:hypothetical protein
VLHRWGQNLLFHPPPALSCPGWRNLTRW